MKIYRFRNCYFNTLERSVLRDGRRLELTPKTLDVLQMLIEKPGEVVTKDEMLGKVWNGSFVEEGNLPVHISRLRGLLGETHAERFIETVQGSGYRFVAPVEPVDNAAWRKHAVHENHLPSNGRPTGLRFDSVAVMPLENESRNPDIDYLTDGLTESFINTLSRFSGLKVMARNTVFRYRNKEIDPQEIGPTLGVSTVLTGRLRIKNDRLMISVELVNATDGTQLWGTQLTHPFSSIIEVQEQIIYAVSQQLRSEISDALRNSIVQSITQNSESYKFYLKGRHFLRKRDPQNLYKAIECFDRSVSYDPINVHSLVQTYECFRMLHVFDYLSRKEFLLKIEPILKVVSTLDQSVDAVQAMHGDLELSLKWNFEKSEQHFQIALNINPGCFIALLRYSELLIFSGRYPEAMVKLDRVMQIDPLSPLTYTRLGRLFFIMTQYDRSLAILKDALELDPTSYETHIIMGAVLSELGEYENALDHLKYSLNLNHNIGTLAMIGRLHALQGRGAEALQVIGQIETQSKENGQYAISLALIYFALGKKELTYSHLESAYRQREYDLLAIKIDPRWAGLRSEERFKKLIYKIGLGEG